MKAYGAKLPLVIVGDRRVRVRLVRNPGRRRVSLDELLTWDRRTGIGTGSERCAAHDDSHERCNRK